MPIEMDTFFSLAMLINQLNILETVDLMTFI